MAGVDETKDRKDLEEFDCEKGDESLSDELHTSANELTEQIYDTVEDISDALINMETNMEIEKTSEGMCSKFDSLIPPLLQWKKEKNEKIASLERSCNEMYTNWQNAELQRKNDLAEIESLKNQIIMQSNYCANVGAVLGRLVWQASNEPEMINFWLSLRSKEKLLGDFLEIADGTISVFFKAYDDALLPKSRDEYKFAMGLLGTLANVSASPAGRELIIEKAAGKRLVKNLVTFLPRFPTDPGLPIKKLILLTLFNVCVNNDGRRYLFELEVGRVVVHCLNDSEAEEIQRLGLTLLQSITYDLEPRLITELFKSVRIEKIRQIADNGQNKISHLARKILDYLSVYENYIPLS